MKGETTFYQVYFGIFLGIVTRCPLELRLKYAKDGSPWRCKLSCTPPGSNDHHVAEIPTPIEVSPRITEGLILS